MAAQNRLDALAGQELGQFSFNTLPDIRHLLADLGRLRGIAMLGGSLEMPELISQMAGSHAARR